MLDPETPPEGVDIPEMLQRKYGGDPKRMQATVEDAARQSGLELDLSKQRFMYPTEKAHTLIRHAAKKGTQAALAKALFRANFVEAKNIADPKVLAEVAAPHGFTAGEVETLCANEAEAQLTRREVSFASRSGIRGVPFFIFNEQLAMSGAQPESVFEEAIAEALELGPPKASEADV
jgi:predicted DsbA family dithiol-disulfide isomerase